MPTKLVLLSTALAAALPEAGVAQDRHGVVIAPPVTAAELAQQRPRGLFFASEDFTVDYNSYSYDDRYHGPAPYYGRRAVPTTFFFAPGPPAYRSSAGGTLHYWPR